MTHHRIRKFNNKDTYPEQNLDSHGAAEQTHKVMQNIR